MYVGVWVALSIDPLLSKSQAHAVILSGAATEEVFPNIVVAFKQTVLAVIAITGFGKIVTVLVITPVQPEEFVTV